MAANTRPIYSVVPDVQWSTGPVLTANTTVDLTAGTIYQIFTASSSEGGRVDKVVVQPLGTNVATVLRLWVNNGSTTSDAGNQAQIRDITMPITTVSQVAAIGTVEIQLDHALAPGYKLYATVGTAQAAGHRITAFGGKY